MSSAERDVEGTVPSSWFLELKEEVARLTAERLRTWNSSAANLETRVRNGVFFDSELGLDAEDALNELVAEVTRLTAERDEWKADCVRADGVIQAERAKNERLVAALETAVVELEYGLRGFPLREHAMTAVRLGRERLTPQADAAGDER